MSEVWEGASMGSWTCGKISGRFSYFAMVQAFPLSGVFFCLYLSAIGLFERAPFLRRGSSVMFAGQDQRWPVVRFGDAAESAILVSLSATMGVPLLQR